MSLLPTRSVGDADPAGDINTLVGALDDNLTTVYSVAAATGVAATDTANIVARLTDASVAGGIVDVHRPGTYVFTALSIPAGVTLRGRPGVVLQQAAGATGTAIVIPSTSTGARVEGVELDGNATNQTTNVVGISTSAARSQIVGCYVHDVKYDGIMVNGVAATGVTIANNTVKTTGRMGITVQATSGADAPYDVVIHGNHVEGTVDGALSIVGVGKHIVFSSNTTRDCGGDGIAAYNAANEDITCVGNTLHIPDNHGIHLGGTRLVIANNTAHGVADGHGWFIWNHDATTADTVAVTGNVVTGTDTGEGVRIDHATNVTVTGNTCESITRHGIYLLSVDDFSCTGNVVNGTTTGRGINVDTCAVGTVSGNTIKSAATDGIGGISSSNVACVANTVDGAVTGIRTTGTATGWAIRANVLLNTTAAYALVGNHAVDGYGVGASGVWVKWGSGGTSSAQILAEARLCYQAFRLTAPTTLDRLGVEITVSGTVGAVIRLGIFSTVDGKVFTLVLDAGTIDGTQAAGAYALTISQLLPPGSYAFGACIQGVAGTRPTLRVTTGADPMTQFDATHLALSAGVFGSVFTSAVTGAFATSYTATAGTTYAPLVCARTV